MGSKKSFPIINEDINEEWISDKTRYACDGLLNQRLDTPFINIMENLKKLHGMKFIKLLNQNLKIQIKIKFVDLLVILTNMESGYIFKEFFDRTLDNKNYESRSDNRFVNINKRENYLFNSTINGIEESDLIFLIGANPRYEATILNARIRKAY